ncbi:ABC transporter substrate-binding protein [Rhizobium leguminosarum]|uniref:Extracellular solute-binding protein n=1 Tax=Rhizobium leguminosarum TaxID=384 RepID=A0A6P0B3R1_RHILE|nr:ABC transporter substrate-binding protein [Rhizobium leguminosarum]MBY5436981.1 ABC transporter substrate-binding protein [Rhizobium leguminosarum]NEI33641.1 extracellular solute-binding protein [Rhizobium leguminosarum]NEI41290.1 extracellular solute-binding protein [Rhizobium leguminosarum]
MKKIVHLAALAAALALPGMAAARDLTIVSWGGIFQDAQRDVFFTPFKTETKAPLSEDSWDGGVGVLRSKAQAGDSNTWDLVEVEAEELTIGCEEGLFEVLDPAKFGGAEKYLPGTASECGVPANIFSIAVAYDGEKFANGPRSWADFWDVKKFPGKRALRSGPKMNLEFALMADGVAANKVYETLATPEGVDRAFAKLDELKPNIVWWTSGNQPMQLLGSGEIAMTTSYNGRIPAANAADKRNFKIIWPGAMLNVDSWVIMKGSPNADSAYKLIEFMAKPAVQANWPAKLNYGVGVTEAQKLVPAELAANLPTAPENLAASLTLDAGFWVNHIDQLTERFSAWAAK